MKYNEQILNIAKDNNGYVTTQEITKNNIPRIYLTLLLKQKKLIKVTRGLYMLPDCFEDEYYKYQISNNTSVFALETSLYLHGLSLRIPTEYQIFVPKQYNGNLQKIKNVKLFYIQPDFINLGVQTILSPYGNKIRVYDIDKTICDIIKYKNKIDPEIFSNALKEYAHLNKKNINHLIYYAKQMKIEEEVRKYMEVLL